MFTYLVQTVNNMYQNVSGKSIENQELILRVFLLCGAFDVIKVKSRNWPQFGGGGGGGGTHVTMTGALTVRTLRRFL